MKIHNKQITARHIQIALGLLWLLDGALQLQRQMFTSSFTTNIVTPASVGQPRIVAGLMHFAVHLFLMHPALFNSFIAITQLGLGILILSKRTVKLGLWLSVGWGLVVWYVGEGLSGLASAHATLLMGAPGAAFIYVILAIAVMPRQNDKEERHFSPAYWLAIVWATIWSLGAIYQLLPGQNRVSELGSMVGANAVNAPGWLASLDIHTANFLYNLGGNTANMHMSVTQMQAMTIQSINGYWFVLLLALVQLAIGLAILVPNYLLRKLTVIVGSIVALGYWVVGQSFGGLYSGHGTDPNTAPLIILLGVAILASKQVGIERLRKDINRSLSKLEHIFT